VAWGPWRNLRTAWISQILVLVTDHNPRVGGSSPSSGMKESPANAGFLYGPRLADAGTHELRTLIDDPVFGDDDITVTFTAISC
jgi:hypothetical protein